MPYYYENHMGGWYTSEYELDYDDLYCVVIIQIILIMKKS